MEVGFRYLPSLGGNDGSNAGRSGKIDLLDGGVGNQLTGDDTSILWNMVQGVEAACRKAGIVKSRGNSPHGSRSSLGILEHNGITPAVSLLVNMSWAYGDI